MWGVCLDNQAMEVGLFQAVIRYEIDHLNNTVVVTLPKTDLRLCVEKIKQLPSPPKFVYGDKVYLCHSGLKGVISAIIWHFKFNCCYYMVEVDGKMNRKRYYDSDLRAWEDTNDR